MNANETTGAPAPSPCSSEQTINNPAPETLAEWRQLTDQNAHTEARLAMCNWLMVELRACHCRESICHTVWTVERMITAIKTIHDLEGHLTPELFELRERYTTAMIDAVRRVSPDVAAMIHNCL